MRRLIDQLRALGARARRLAFAPVVTARRLYWAWDLWSRLGFPWSRAWALACEWED